MRVAIVSDLHGNLTAFEAVLSDLKKTSPDLIFHGGDLADGGASPVEVIDRIRGLGWQGVVGNTDELLFDPKSLSEFARPSSAHSEPLFSMIEQMAQVTRELLGEDRLAWLRTLPQEQSHGAIALVHASPESRWRAPLPETSDQEMELIYGALGQPIIVYAHIHRPYIRRMATRIVANSGSVGLPYDGDRRAAYLVVDESGPVIHRVEYDIEKEVKALSQSRIPHTEWIARTLLSGSFQMPQTPHSGG